MRPPVALTIAGSDPSGGAGIQADLKTFSALGAYGCAVLTALTAQSTRGVTGVHAVPPAFVAEQLDTLLGDVRITAVKVGMLANAETVELVAGYLRGPLAACHRVLDPVMVSTSGSQLLADDAVAAVRDSLGAADVVTPNLSEAAVLLGADVATSVDEMRAQGEAILALGAKAVLMKGGHLTGDAVDLLVTPEGAEEFRGGRVETENTHGTGCTLSSALAALRPRRPSWGETVRDAKDWLAEALRHADELEIGGGAGPVHHFHEARTGRWS